MLLEWSRVPLLDKKKHRDEVVCAAALSEAGRAGYTWETFVAIEACEEVGECFRGKWISMFRLYMEGGAVGSVLENAGTEVFEFFENPGPCACTGDTVDRYLSGDKRFGCK